MMNRVPPALATILAIVGLAPIHAAADDTKTVNWPGFRGPSAEGVAHGYPTPTRWDVQSGENIKWKTPIPGLGHSSPVIWGDRLFVTTAVSGVKDPTLKPGLYGNVDSVDEDTEHRWRIFCLDKNTGKVKWKKTAVRSVPRVKRHAKATHANSTPATDGKHVVTFLGSEGLFCYTVRGKLLWKKDLGELDAGWYVRPAAQWGFGSSPVIDRGRVYVQCDVQQGSFVAAFDVKTGREIWRTPRQDVPTWGTPAIYRKGADAQLIVNGYRHIGGYDLETGRERWRLTGGGDIPVPTPVIGLGLIFITNAHGRAAPLYAIRPTARGDITPADGATSNEHIAWSVQRNGAYMQTPLVLGRYLYSCSDMGILKCYQAATGEIAYKQRLGAAGPASVPIRGRQPEPGLGDEQTEARRSAPNAGTFGWGFTASPVAADDKIYFTSEDGAVFVVRPGPKCEVLAVNLLDEVCMATPAISEGVLFFRTQGHVVAVGKGKPPPPGDKP